MPYRRLPNTDQARIRSLTAVIDTMRTSDLYVPVLSPELYNRTEKKLRSFKGASDIYCYNLEQMNGYTRSDAYQNRLKNARMYVSHFLIVLNLCIKRGEIKLSDRVMYDLPQDETGIPDLTSDISVIRCCENTIKGEKARTARGGMPIFNPTIAKVNVHYDLFREMYDEQQQLRKKTEESLAAVAAMRADIDETILECWNAIEAFFKDLEGEKKLEACRKYGIIYYYRPGEKRNR